MKLVLHGALGAEYGHEFNLGTRNVPNAVRLLAAQLPGFRKKFVDGWYRIVLGNPNANGIELDERDLLMPVADEAHLIPVAAGAKSGGVKAVIGAIILVAAIVLAPVTGGGSLALGAEAFSVAGVAVSYGSVAMFGFAMLAGGVSMMMAPQVKSDYESREDQRPSFMFNGAVNTTEQGTVIPVVYGVHLVGSKPISAGLYIEQIYVPPPPPPPPDPFDPDNPPVSDPGGWNPMNDSIA